MKSKYGKCKNCNTELIPIWFKEEEHKIEDGRLSYTGRIRRACSHLECPFCLKKECIDDTFDGEWY